MKKREHEESKGHSNYFIAARQKWIIIKNRNYEKLRMFPGYTKFADLEHVDTDAVNVRRGIEGLGARTSDIIEIENADF